MTPRHFTEEELLKYISNASKKIEIESHLETCQFCYKKYIDLLELQNGKENTPSDSVFNRIIERFRARTGERKTITAIFDGNELSFTSDNQKLLRTEDGFIFVLFQDIRLGVSVSSNQSGEFLISFQDQEKEEIFIFYENENGAGERISLKNKEKFGMGFQMGKYEFRLLRNNLVIGILTIDLRAG